MKKEYKKTHAGNLLTKISDGCFISYNPSLEANLAGKSETALIFISEDEKNYFICHDDKRHVFDDCETQASLIDKAISFRDSPEFEMAFWSEDWAKLEELRAKS